MCPDGSADRVGCASTALGKQLRASVGESNALGVNREVDENRLRRAFDAENDFGLLPGLQNGRRDLLGDDLDEDDVGRRRRPGSTLAMRLG